MAQKVKFGDETIEIQTVLVDGVEYLFLEDVQEEFPSVTRFCIGTIRQPFARDKDGNKIEPLRIKACVDQIVEAMEPIIHSNDDINGRLDRLEGKIDRIEPKIDRIDANTQEILRKIRQVMIQMYELHEYTTPRYFFIFPTKHSEIALINSVQNLFQLHYKLYFLCECSDDPNKMHIAPHDGYSIKKTKDFIVTYGPYLRTTLSIVKFLLSAGGNVLPPLGTASTIIDAVVPSKFQSNEFYEDMQRQLQLVNNLIDKFDNQQSRTSSSMQQHDKSQIVPLQGAELRELDTYLELIDSKRSLGNLYRIVTDDGHVRWVCLEHYDEISYHKKMRKYIDELEAMGGKFDEKTKEAVVIGAKITEKNVKTLCEALTNGFNIQKLIFQECSLFESDLGMLLAVVINRSSIYYFLLVTVEVRRLFSRNYVCKYMRAELLNRSCKVRFYGIYEDGNKLMLIQLLQQNKIHRILNLSACDFLWHEQDLKECLDDNGNMTGLIVEYSNNIDLFNTVFNLTTKALHQLKLSNSMWTATTLHHLYEVLKKNKTLLDIDLMDEIGFEDETFVVNVLDALRSHKSIKSLSLHVQKVQPSSQKENHLIKSLKNDKFITHLCISTSDVSHELTEALIFASKERNTLIYLEFYNCQVKKDDGAKLQSLQSNANLIQLTFCERPRWLLMQQKNEHLNKSKSSRFIDARNTKYS